MSPEIAAWLAGLLEGEGAFMRRVNKRRGVEYYTAKIEINMTDQDVIETVAKIFRTKPRMKRAARDNCKAMYHAGVEGARALELMREIRPWMHSRRAEKIDELLRDYSSPVLVNSNALPSNSK